MKPCTCQARRWLRMAVADREALSAGPPRAILVFDLVRCDRGPSRPAGCQRDRGDDRRDAVLGARRARDDMTTSAAGTPEGSAAWRLIQATRVSTDDRRTVVNAS